MCTDGVEDTENVFDEDVFCVFVEEDAHCSMRCVSPYYNGFMFFACGRCSSCRKTRTNNWVLRLMHESNSWKYTYFLTLTYSDDFLPADKSLNKRDPQLWLKRFRKASNTKIRYWLVGEYGGMHGRCHYHAILYCNIVPELFEKLLTKTWHLGFVKFRLADEASYRYCCKYLFKQLNGDIAADYYKGRLPPFKVCSTGIGLEYAQKHVVHFFNNLGIRVNGHLLPVPRYYRKKLGLVPPVDIIKSHLNYDECNLIYHYLRDGNQIEPLDSDMVEPVISSMISSGVINKYELMSKINEARKKYEESALRSKGVLK